MARRFGVRIAKGVRLNFNKTGPKLSVNYKTLLGLNRRSTIKLPKMSTTSGNRNSTVPQGRYTFNINDDGSAVFYDSDGNRVYNETLIRKMKATDSFKQQKQRILEERKEERQKEFETEQARKFKDIQGETDNVIKIHEHCPKVFSESDFISEINGIVPQKYTPRAFDREIPTKESVLSSVTLDAYKNVNAPFWKRKKMISEYIDQNVDVKYNRLLEEYNKEKEEFDIQEEKFCEEMNTKAIEEAELRKKEMEAMTINDTSYIEKSFEDWLNSVILTVSFGVDFEYIANDNVLMIDLQLPEIGEMPQEKAVTLSSGTVKAKNKSQKEIKQEYIMCVFGLALFISSNAFNINTSIKNIIISGYTDRRNDKTGDIVKDCVYSLKIPRSDLEKHNISLRDPQQLCLSFENRCNINSQLVMKPVEPF